MTSYPHCKVILAKKVMKNFNKSLCALAVMIGMSGFTASAFADDTPTLSPSAEQVQPSTSPAPVSKTDSVSKDSKTVAEKDSKKSQRDIDKEELEKLDYSNYNQEAVLRKVAVLQSMLQLKKLQKDILDVNKDSDNQDNQNQGQMQSNPMTPPMGMGFNQQAPSAPTQAATALTTPTVIAEPAPVIKATAVYSLGNTSYAEISFNGNKTVVKAGEVLPNGYKVTSLNPLGITLQKGKTKMSLPIVGDNPSQQDANSIASSNTNSNTNGMSNNGIVPPPVSPPSFQMSAPVRR